MSIIHEAITLISTGYTLQSVATTDLQSRVTLGQEHGEFVLLSPETPQRFDRADRAVLCFRQIVGRSGLSNAVGDFRYRLLFPQGSSLDWPPIPVLKAS